MTLFLTRPRSNTTYFRIRIKEEKLKQVVEEKQIITKLNKR